MSHPNRRNTFRRAITAGLILMSMTPSAQALKETQPVIHEASSIPAVTAWFIGTINYPPSGNPALFDGYPDPTTACDVAGNEYSKLFANIPHMFPYQITIESVPSANPGGVTGNIFRCWIQHLQHPDLPPLEFNYTTARQMCPDGYTLISALECSSPTHCPVAPKGEPEFTLDAGGLTCSREVSCPISLAPTNITDPVAQLYEDGAYNSTDKPDLLHLNEATRTGLACIVQKVNAINCYKTSRPTSGYRPTAYQKHIRDVYDNWMKIKDNNSPECAERKNAAEAEYNEHKPFARRPGATSNHSQLDAAGNPAGNAVDISGVPDNALDSADAIAAQCNMKRPLMDMPNPADNDPIHYQPK